MQLVHFPDLHNSTYARSTITPQSMSDDKRNFVDSREYDDGYGEEDVDTSASKPAPKRRGQTSELDFACSSILSLQTLGSNIL